jgi:class 3 adenylate cyclase
MRHASFTLELAINARTPLTFIGKSLTLFPKAALIAFAMPRQFSELWPCLVRYKTDGLRPSSQVQWRGRYFGAQPSGVPVWAAASGRGDAMGIVSDLERAIRDGTGDKNQESDPGLRAGLKYLAGELEKLANRVATLEKAGPDDHD